MNQNENSIHYNDATVETSIHKGHYIRGGRMPGLIPHIPRGGRPHDPPEYCVLLFLVVFDLLHVVDVLLIF